MACEASKCMRRPCQSGSTRNTAATAMALPISVSTMRGTNKVWLSPAWLKHSSTSSVMAPVASR